VTSLTARPIFKRRSGPWGRTQTTMLATPSILKRTHLLDAGPPVRLRLVRRGDEAAIAELLESRGLSAQPSALRALVQFDPQARLVLCALADDEEPGAVLGLAAIDLREGADLDTLVVDERATPGLGSLLGRVLRAQAAARARRAA
jgi:hypothetical protein